MRFWRSEVKIHGTWDPSGFQVYLVLGMVGSEWLGFRRLKEDHRDGGTEDSLLSQIGSCRGSGDQLTCCWGTSR